MGSKSPLLSAEDLLTALCFRDTIEGADAAINDDFIHAIFTRNSFYACMKSAVLRAFTEDNPKLAPLMNIAVQCDSKWGIPHLLAMAVFNGATQCFHYLAQCRPHIIFDKDRECLLVQTAAFNRSFIPLVLKLDVDPNAADGLMLYMAANKGWLAEFVALLEHPRIDVSTSNYVAQLGAKLGKQYMCELMLEQRRR